MRENITLKCTSCGEENYISTKNKSLHPQRVEYKKFCPRENKMTIHREKK
ncbi:MAG: 50S ribosomal protein L33 [Erysipelothrix sp.]|nr:50S ribosomal protein L33 [Erysipelothrix sp.]